jgi:agmatinase
MEIPNNFGALEEEFSSYDKSKVVVLPIPYDATRTWVVGEGWESMDASEGPKAIIQASRNMELYDIEIDKTAAEIGIHTLPELRVEKDTERTVDKIEQEANEHLEKNKFIVMLGGEHSITTGAVRAYHKKYPKMSVLQIDAHSDLRDEFEEGGKYSHAAVMSRVTEICPAV